MEKAYRSITYFFALLLVLMAFGFYKPYFSQFPDFDRSITTIVHIHATALIMWVLLLVIQPLLIRLKNIRLHRLLGKLTYFLVPVILVTSAAVMVKQYNESIAARQSSLQGLKALLIPFAEILLFTLFYLLAIVHRHRVALHMRYIICTALVLITPILARVMGYWFFSPQLVSYCSCFLLSDLLLLALIYFDRRRRANYRPYVLCLILFLIFHFGWLLAGHPF